MQEGLIQEEIGGVYRADGILHWKNNGSQLVYGNLGNFLGISAGPYDLTGYAFY